MKAFRFLRALPLALMLLAAPVHAEQGTIVGPITGPHTMADVMGTINASLLAIQSCNSGTSAPANGVGAAATHYQCWADTTTNPVVVKMYDGTSWAIVGKLNTSTHVWTPSYQGTDTGTASVGTTGTSGHTIPYLDAANTWSAIQSGATAAVDTNTTQFATTAFVLAQAASATPLIDGSAAAGASTRYARADHIHPTDTTRSPVVSPTFTGTPAAPTPAVDTNTTQLATTAYVIGQASASGDGTPAMDGTAARGTGTHFARNDHVHPIDTSRAPLASPALTGTPTAPTASPNTNSTQLATTAYADAIAALKANIASPTFTGTPAAPTAAGGTNTTQLATTQFVQSAVVASTSGVASIAGNTGAFTLANGIDNSTNQIQLTAARRTLPTTQYFTSGTALTYTPTSPNVLWIEVYLQGGGGVGGAGAASGTSGGGGGGGGGEGARLYQVINSPGTGTYTVGAAGAATTFSMTSPSFTLSAGAGSAGTIGQAGTTTTGGQGTAGGAGGTSSGSTSNALLPGAPGSAGSTGSYSTTTGYGGAGGSGGGRGGGAGGVGVGGSAVANSGGGAAGGAGGTGAAGSAAGTAAAGNILIIEHYGS